jgi:hypothetical protein
MAIPRRFKRPRRGAWSAEEQRALETAAAEGLITRIENGAWPESWERFSWRKVQAEMFASQRERR